MSHIMCVYVCEFMRMYFCVFRTYNPIFIINKRQLMKFDEFSYRTLTYICSAVR